MNSIFLIKGIKRAAIASLFCCILSCSFFSEDSKAQNNMDREASKPAIKDNQEGYIVKPNYEHPKFKELDATFAKQEHRFEIDRCEFKYNDQSFFIGDSEEKIISILGEPDKKSENNSLDKNYFKYKKLKLLIWFSNKTKKVISFGMILKNYPGFEGSPYRIFKLRKIPYQLDMTLNEFLELSDLKHGENLSHDTSAFYIENELECSIVTETSIGSTPSYHSDDLGGHMTTRGAFNLESTGPIDVLDISLKKL